MRPMSVHSVRKCPEFTKTLRMLMETLPRICAEVGPRVASHPFVPRAPSSPRLVF